MPQIYASSGPTGLLASLWCCLIFVIGCETEAKVNPWFCFCWFTEAYHLYQSTPWHRTSHWYFTIKSQLVPHNESCHIHGLHYMSRVSPKHDFLLALFFRHGISFKPHFIESSYRWISHWHVTYEWVTCHVYMCVCAYVAIYIHVRTITLSHMHTPNRGAHTNSCKPHYVVYRDCVRVCLCGYINLYSTCK